jgi:hypothetical protein
MKKIIIQCSGAKNGEPWKVSRLGGIKVKFVSHPEYRNEVTLGIKLFKPDDMVPDHITSWKQYLSLYNKSKHYPDHLKKDEFLIKLNAMFHKSMLVLTHTIIKNCFKAIPSYPLYMGNGSIATPVSGRCAEGGNRTLIPFGTRF